MSLRAIWAVGLMPWVVLSCTALAPDPLGDLHPVIWPRRGVLRLEACRWPTRARVGVSLPEQGPEEARHAVEAAFRAWQRADLPLRLEIAEPERARIRISLAETSPLGDDGRPLKGVTATDCRVAEDGALALARARVIVSLQTTPDVRGNVRGHEPAEIAGIALHELGHALGYQGHARSAGDEAMVATPETLRRLGRRALRGGAADSPAVRALYSGAASAVTRRVRVDDWRTAPCDRLLEIGRAERWEGPFLRVGDRQARIFWERPSGPPLVLAVLDVQALLGDPESLLLIPNREARRWLRAERE